MPPKQLPAIAAGFEFPALLAETAMALEGGGNVATLFTTSLHNGGAERVRLTQHHHRDTHGGLELPNQLGGQFGGVAEGQPSDRTVCLFAREPDAQRNDLITADRNGTDILMAPDVGGARGVLHLGDGGHGLTPLGFPGIIDHQGDGCSGRRLRPWSSPWAYWRRAAAGSPRSTKKKLWKRVRWCSVSSCRYRLATCRLPHVQTMVRTTKYNHERDEE